MLVTREDLSTLPYSVNAILELKKTTSRFKRTYNKAYPVYDSGLSLIHISPRGEMVNQLQGRYALQTSTAEWALNCLMTEELQRNPDRDAVKELRKNFLEQGGKVM